MCHGLVTEREPLSGVYFEESLVVHALLTLERAWADVMVFASSMDASPHLCLSNHHQKRKKR